MNLSYWRNADASYRSKGGTNCGNGTWIPADSMGKVLQISDAVGGWFRMKAPQDGDYTFTVLNGDIDVDSMCIVIHKEGMEGQGQTWLRFGRSNALQSQTFEGVKAGEVLHWWNSKQNSGKTLTSPFKMMITLGTPAAQPAASTVQQAPAASTVQQAPAASVGTSGTILTGSLRVGDTFTMGYYEQDGYTDNGREPIEWLVLETNGGTATAISAKALDCIQYHPYLSSNLAWGVSGIRLWLNYMFRYEAFNDGELACLEGINSSRVVDYVSMLDEKQVTKYGLTKTGCDVTDYGKRRGVEIGNDNGKGCWWVRVDKTGKRSTAKFVGIHGKVYASNQVTVANNGVRPVICVDVSALQRCARTSEMKYRTATAYGFTNQKIATRSGPSQEYDEIHTFSTDMLPVGSPVRVLRRMVTNGTPWVEIEFMVQGMWYRVWTGNKRVDHVNTSNLPGDYSQIDSGVVSMNTRGWYGPGEKYAVLYKSIAQGTAVQIMGVENGWYLIQYKDPKHIIRTWVPADAVMLN